MSKRRALLLLSIGIGLPGLLAGLLVVLVYRPHWLPLLWLLPYQDRELGAGVDATAAAALQEVRVCTRSRFRVLSAYRDPEKNTKVGGSSGSKHLQGTAFDLAVPQSRRGELFTCAKDAGFAGYGWGNRSVHVDLGPRRWWTYNDDGQAMQGAAARKFLHKAPDEFKKDWGLNAAK